MDAGEQMDFEHDAKTEPTFYLGAGKAMLHYFLHAKCNEHEVNLTCI